MHILKSTSKNEPNPKHSDLRLNGVPPTHSQVKILYFFIRHNPVMTTRDNYPPATWPALPNFELPAALDFLKLKNFPLKVYPAVYDRPKLQHDTLYIHGPGWRKSSASFDVDCLQIQARIVATQCSCVLPLTHVRISSCRSISSFVGSTLKYITATSLSHHRQVGGESNGIGKEERGQAVEGPGNDDDERWDGVDNWLMPNADHPFRQTPFLGYCNRGYL